METAVHGIEDTLRWPPAIAEQLAEQPDRQWLPAESVHQFDGTTLICGYELGITDGGEQLDRRVLVDLGQVASPA